MSIRDVIRFVHDGCIREISSVDPTLTVLRYLREHAHRTGTKEGCSEGDCGACTVAIGELDGDHVRYRAVNACIQFLPTLDGKILLTIEDLKSATGALHPVQRAMVDHHASQCGFCTPGFVMSLFALHKENARPSVKDIDTALAGNLCRCTGYGPIKAAALSMSVAPDRSAPAEKESAYVSLLRKIQNDDMVAIEQGNRRYFAPRTVEELADVLSAYPDATLLAGGTDVGLWVTKQHRWLGTVVYLGRVDALNRVEDQGDAVEIGAAVTYTDAYDALASLHPDLGELMRRLGSRQIRNLGTVVGNIANGSPIGDSPPALIALGATLRLRKRSGVREIPIEEFFIDYNVQDLHRGEFIESVRVRKLDERDRFRVYKLSKRYDQDISAVCGAFRIRLNGDTVEEARICFGGMATTPKRATACEALLAGKRWTEQSVAAAQRALRDCYQPLSDMRGSAPYRSNAAVNLLFKFFLETGRQAGQTRVFDHSPVSAGAIWPPDTDGREGERIEGDVRTRFAHDSARKHVTGEAAYVDDMPEPARTRHLRPVLSTHARARIAGIDMEAARAVAGVVHILTEADIPGPNDFGHARLGDDRVLSCRRVDYVGQVVCVVVAETIDAAQEAAGKVRIDYEDETPIVTTDQAVERQSFLAEPRSISTGGCAEALSRAPRRLKGRVATGAQEHFYLEGQIALAVPKEDGDVYLYSSTQDPTAVQNLVARVLGKPANAVTVEVRRMGGAFGGKETQATQFAAIAALAALKTGCPAKMRLDRDDDMKITGKRHAFESGYEVGFDDDGRIHALSVDMAMCCGHSEDQSPYILHRALHHLDNSYYLEHTDFVGRLCKTNIASACAFRGFGTPQALVVTERVIDGIAFELGKDPLEIRKVNLYGVGERNITPFGGIVHDNLLHELLAELETSSHYAERRAKIRRFNRESDWIKKGIALVPIKYGISFGGDTLEQAGALLHVYQDGSIHLNHGGTEMGQGLFVKCAQIVAHELQVDCARIKISGTATDKVPNTTATAASCGTDFNGMAVQAAAREIRRRLTRFASEHYSIGESQIEFLPNRVRVGNQTMLWETLVQEAYVNRISLSATGYYRTPRSEYDPNRKVGNAHRYHAYGACCSEVVIDTLTGEYRVVRVDILHDVGRSINPAIDYGQLEGGFIQGMGWLTCEEVVWDTNGILRTHAPSTYKIPTAGDRPADLRMKLVDWSENRVESVHGSKAIGEPPLTLAVAVFCALTDAVASAGDYKVFPELDAPATPERVMLAVESVHQQALA